jgi:hypothetical protein
MTTKFFNHNHLLPSRAENSGLFDLELFSIFPLEIEPTSKPKTLFCRQHELLAGDNMFISNGIQIIKNYGFYF